jgi:hypothetical protein
MADRAFEPNRHGVGAGEMPNIRDGAGFRDTPTFFEGHREQGATILLVVSKAPLITLR